MREQKSVYYMTDRELRIYKRGLRRQQAARRRLISVIATICLVVMCVISYHSLTGSANTGNDELSFKYYTRITVGHNDTLWDIADDYIDYNKYTDKQKYIDEVCSINHLEDADDLVAGRMLVVPYYSGEYIN